MAKRPLRDKEEPLTITQKKILLVEGSDDVNFFKPMFTEKNIATIQIIPMEGKYNLKTLINDLKGIAGYADVNAILILRDSDKSAKSESQSINSALKSTGLIDKDIEPFTIKEFNGKQIGFMLFPGYDDSGNLCETGAIEDLCLRILTDQPVAKQVGEYFADFLKDKTRTLSHENKNRLHATFSFTNKYVGKKIKDVANVNSFDFNSQYLVPFLDIIKRIELVGE
ncbi:hypothetical protein AGMMS49940_02780 [Spirochaetia bacterium]|nr:hypothetical protein AGMMS49940_02780 [Spirochaetia bacterium]